MTFLTACHDVMAITTQPLNQASFWLAQRFCSFLKRDRLDGKRPFESNRIDFKDCFLTFWIWPFERCRNIHCIGMTPRELCRIVFTMRNLPKYICIVESLKLWAWRYRSSWHTNQTSNTNIFHCSSARKSPQKGLECFGLGVGFIRSGYQCNCLQTFASLVNIYKAPCIH